MFMKLGTGHEEVKAGAGNAGNNPEASHIGHRANRREKPLQSRSRRTSDIAPPVLARCAQTRNRPIAIKRILVQELPPGKAHLFGSRQSSLIADH